MWKSVSFSRSPGSASSASIGAPGISAAPTDDYSVVTNNGAATTISTSAACSTTAATAPDDDAAVTDDCPPAAVSSEAMPITDDAKELASNLVESRLIQDRCDSLEVVQLDVLWP